MAFERKPASVTKARFFFDRPMPIDSGREKKESNSATNELWVTRGFSDCNPLSARAPRLYFGLWAIGSEPLIYKFLRPSAQHLGSETRSPVCGLLLSLSQTPSRVTQ
ncbi:Uncharacterized protein HZ326_19077 [Fusarium oxysporum f. sp. albedinis]|nr:Uncharacterized protein HZ326_19077 [Fusarium oxysporum f. sp. albedinis]